MANPRTIDGARRRGWTVVTIRGRSDRSWLGILIGIDRLVGGTYYVEDYDFRGGGTVAFEDPGLAAMVALKFGV